MPDVIVAIDSEDEVDDNDRLEGRRINPARGGASSEGRLNAGPDPAELELEDKLEMDDEELLGDKLGVEGVRRGDEGTIAGAGMMTPDRRSREREKVGAVVSAKVGADLLGLRSPPGGGAVVLIVPDLPPVGDNGDVAQRPGWRGDCA